MRANPRPVLALLVIISVLLGAARVDAQIYVKKDAPGLNDGSSWADAYTDLQDALAAAAAGNEIWVAAAVYTPDPGDSTIAFDLPDGVAVYGGFEGTEAIREDRDWSANVTILSGDIGAPGSADNSFHVVTCTGSGPNTILDGFTVSGGRGDPSSRTAGGLHIDNGDVAVANTIFEGNSSRQLGGAIYVDGGSPTFANVDFAGNSAGAKIGITTYPGYGGAVYVFNASPTFQSCAFDSNAALYSGSAGGVRCFGTGTATFTDCTFDGNTGSAIADGTVVATNCTFTNNTGGALYSPSGTITNCTAVYNGSGLSIVAGMLTGCTSEFNDGPGLGVHTGTVVDCVSRNNTGSQGVGLRISGNATVSNCIIMDNVAVHEGGGIYMGGSASPTITNCQIVGNSSQTSGGGVFSGFGAEPILVNCVIANNTAVFGGGGWSSSEGCSSQLTNVTFYGNSTPNFNSAIHVSSGCVEIYNSVAWNNTAQPVTTSSGGTITFFSSLVEGSGGSSSWDVTFGADGGGNLDADPLFIDATGGYLGLSLGSPAIDAGDNGAPNVTSPDLAGNTRIVGAAIDLGAYEFTCPAGPRVYVDADAAGAGDGTSWTDAFPTLQEALSVACSTVTEIWVADGTYTPTAGDERAKAFQLVSGVAVYGGFAGDENALAQRDIGANKAVLSGEIAAPGLDDNSFHVISGSGVDNTAILDGFTVTGGSATGGYPDDRGGGMVSVSGDPAVRNVTFFENRAFTGGGIANVLADIELTNAMFFGNSALTSVGGAIHNTVSSPAITNVTVYNNSALGGAGGIYNNSGAPTLTNAIVWGNSGVEISNGGSANLVISHSLIEGSGGSSSWDTAMGTDGGANIDDDPMFVNAGSGNLRLTIGSPAIDAGDNSAPNLLAIDLDGHARIEGGTVDMGAYEAEVVSAADNDTPPAPATAFRAVYPNPFNPAVTIAFDVRSAGPVDISAYDVSGRLVRRLIGGSLPAGPHVTQWDGRDEHGRRVASGVYILRLESQGSSDRRKIVLLK